jgi:membrane protein YdbS with pleckstrin-like domain
VSAGYFILEPDGTRDGPYAKEELLDLMDAGEISPATQCMDAASGRVSEAGSLFRVLAPVQEKPAPAAWKPSPFREETLNNPNAVDSPAPPRVRLVYCGSPCILTYWRSVLAAALLIGGGFFVREWVPEMLALGLIAGMLVLLLAVLHRMRHRFIVTSARVEWHRGLIAKSSRELPVSAIRSINVTHSGASGLLDIGRITFSSAAGAHEDITFDRVWRASALKNRVRRLQESSQ